MIMEYNVFLTPNLLKRFKLTDHFSLDPKFGIRDTKIQGLLMWRR